jgi:hypothetical protein
MIGGARAFALRPGLRSGPSPVHHRDMMARGPGCLSKYAAVTLVPCFGMAVLATACSGEAGRERDDTLANLPAAGAAGTSATGEGTAAMPGTGPELRVSESWVDGATNGVGVQGAFFTYQDGSGRTLITPDATRTQTGYCVAGTAAEVLDGNFGGTYGAVAALNLSQQVDSTTADAYDATAYGVVGFGFDIVGNTGGALRFVVKQYATHDGFCINRVPDCASGCTATEVRLDELTQNCWTPGGPTPAATSLQALEWQITTTEGAETAFDYCIENLHALVDPSLVPARPAPAAPAENEPERNGGY